MPRQKQEAATERCHYDGNEVVRDHLCEACHLYNAAVSAQGAAADAIARSHEPTSKNAWLNEHGVFAWVDGVTKQLAPAEHAAPFVALTSAARRATEKRSADPTG